jgi:hypothetical protein
MRHAPSLKLLGVSSWLVVMAVGRIASAQAQAPAPRYKPQPLILQRRSTGMESVVEAGRARMKKGDCQGALEAFDAALRKLADPTIVRDRGICNEKLGFPFPAMDDYRAYLTSRPDAPDADAIRARLVRLEGNGAEHDTPAEADDVPPASAPFSSASKKKDSDASAAEPEVVEAEKRDKLDFSSRDENVNNSPLRAGKGAMLYPFFAERKWLISWTPFPFQDTGGSTWSECVGVGFRYSLSAGGALVVEGGYELTNGPDGLQLTRSGLMLLVAYELRFPLDPSYNSQFFLAPGLGYEHIMAQSGDPTQSSLTEGALVPRARFGYRRMLGHSMALDVSADAGFVKVFQYSGPTPANEPTGGLLGANVAVVWGL